MQNSKTATERGEPLALSTTETDREQELKARRDAKADEIFTKIMAGGDFIGGKRDDPPPFIIEGVMRAGQFMSLSGGSKSHKTWVTLEMAICVALGIHWQGNETDPKGKRVLYIDGELPKWHLQERVNSILAEKLKTCGGSERERQKMLEGFAENFRAIPLREMKWDRESVEQAIKRLCGEDEFNGFRPQLVFLDPIYTYYPDEVSNKPFDENSAGHVKTLLTGMRDFYCTELGAALLYVSHFSKGRGVGQVQIERVVGSGVHGRMVDGAITITEDTSDDAGESDCIIEYTVRTQMKPETRYVKFSHPIMVDRQQDSPFEKPTGRPAKGSLDIAYELTPGFSVSNDWKQLTKLPGIPGVELLKAIKDRIKCGDTKGKEVIRDAWDAGLIEKVNGVFNRTPLAEFKEIAARQDAKETFSKARAVLNGNTDVKLSQSERKTLIARNLLLVEQSKRSKPKSKAKPKKKAA